MSPQPIDMLLSMSERPFQSLFGVAMPHTPSIGEYGGSGGGEGGGGEGEGEVGVATGSSAMLERISSVTLNRIANS